MVFSGSTDLEISADFSRLSSFTAFHQLCTLLFTMYNFHDYTDILARCWLILIHTLVDTTTKIPVLRANSVQFDLGKTIDLYGRIVKIVHSVLLMISW